MPRYIITDQELENIIQASGDVVRGAFGNGNMGKAQDKLDRLERIVEGREIPDDAIGFYLIDGNGDDKCLEFPE